MEESFQIEAWMWVTPTHSLHECPAPTSHLPAVSPSPPSWDLKGCRRGQNSAIHAIHPFTGKALTGERARMGNR